MRPLRDPRCLNGDLLEQAGALTTRLRFRRGELLFDVLSRPADATDAAVAEARNVVREVTAESVGIAIREFVLAPLSAGQLRRRDARHLRYLIAAGIAPDAAPPGLSRLRFKAELLAINDVPSIVMVADPLASGHDVDELMLSRLLGDGQRIGYNTQLTATGASVVARIRGGEHVTSASINLARDPLSGLTAEITTRRDSEPKVVRDVLAVRDAVKQSPEFDATGDQDIARLFQLGRDLRRGRGTADSLIDAAWPLARTADALCGPIPAPVRVVLQDRATQTAMIARCNEVITERACGIAIPNFAGWVTAALALADITDSHREAKARFQSARQVAAAFLDAEQEAISRIALEVARRTTLTEHDITRVLGS